MASSIYRIKRTSTAEALLDFNLDYADSFNLQGQGLVFRNNFQPTRIFVRPGVSISLDGSASIADTIYLEGDWADYKNAIQLSNNTLTLSRGAGNTGELVEFLHANTSVDTLVFNNGSVTVAQIYAVLHPENGSPPAVIEGANPLDAVSPVGPLSSATVTAPPSVAGQRLDIKAVLVDPNGENALSFGPGTKLTVNGSMGVDRVYVTDGSEVYAVNLRGGIDEVYVRGNSSDYTPDLTTLGVLKLTRNVKLGGTIYTESVSAGFSQLNNDWLVFADGAIRTYVAGTAFKTNAQANLPTSLASVEGWTTNKLTPGLTAQLDLSNVTSGYGFSNSIFISLM